MTLEINFRWRWGNLRRYFQFGSIPKNELNHFLNFSTKIKMFRHGNLDETKLKIPSYIAQPLRIGVDLCLSTLWWLCKQNTDACRLINGWIRQLPSTIPQYNLCCITHSKCQRKATPARLAPSKYLLYVLFQTNHYAMEC